MKTVITSTGNSLKSDFDERFGRADWFCILEEKGKKAAFIKNEMADATGGAGVKAAETMAELGVKRVISGDFGPKAKDLLEKLNIEMVLQKESNVTIGDVISGMDE
ncbi:MAG: NifB/NifX family molybdenum-iron cluster-binding protein [Bacteroidota bacterium]